MPSSNESFRAAVGALAVATLVGTASPGGAQATPAGGGAPLRVDCPSQLHLDPKQVAVADAPAGFSATVEAGPLWLTGLSVFDGPAAEGASLKPDRASRDGGATWRLGGGASWPRGVFLSCDYGPGLVHLTRALDPVPRECEAHLAKSGAAGFPSGGFTCL